MDFGMIDYTGLTENMFILPEKEQPYLRGNKNAHPKIYIGLSEWTYKEDEKKKSTEQPKPGSLGFYSGYFDSVEMDNSYDAIPDEDKVQSWYKAALGPGFKFCPMFYKGITNVGPIGLSKLGLTNDFINRMKGFKEKLGTSFIQLPENMGLDKKETLLPYLQKLPADFEVSLEVRNTAWFSHPQEWETFVFQLNRMNKGLVVADTPGKRDLVHMQLSNNTAFIRFNCLGDHELDLFRIEQWKKQLKSWFLQGLQSCYFFLHIHNKEAVEDFVQYVKFSFKF